MGRKGKHVTRTARAIPRDKFPIWSLAKRRKELKEEYLNQCEIYKSEKKKVYRVKEKVRHPIGLKHTLGSGEHWMTSAVFASFACLLSKISMFVFSKVKQINMAEEVLSWKGIQKPCSEKRKALKRNRNPTAIKEDNSEEYSVPEAKRCCERQKKKHWMPVKLFMVDILRTNNQH